MSCWSHHGSHDRITTGCVHQDCNLWVCTRTLTFVVANQADGDICGHFDRGGVMPGHLRGVPDGALFMSTLVADGFGTCTVIASLFVAGGVWQLSYDCNYVCGWWGVVVAHWL